MGESAYTLIRSKRRRRTIEIRVDPKLGVVVRAPMRAPLAEIEDLLRRRSEWIRLRQAEIALRPVPARLDSGVSVPYLGRPVSLEIESAAVKRTSVALQDGRIRIVLPSPLEAEARTGAAEKGLELWYRAEAARHLDGSIAHWSPVVGREPTRVIVRHQKRLWGSCAPDGTIRFNWRLVQLDPSLMDYVVVHELSHLAVRNHSAPFWAEVGRVMPDQAERRRALRSTGVMVVL